MINKKMTRFTAKGKDFTRLFSTQLKKITLCKPMNIVLVS
jgi:hypothetical protein